MIAQKKIAAAVIVAAVGVLATAGSTSATPVLVAGSNVWNSWTTSQLLGGPFWANPSYDRNGYANIGYFMSGTPGTQVPGFFDASPRSTLSYWGDGSTTFALLLTDPSQTTELTHLLSITGWDDEFGLFNVATGEKHPLFSAWETRGLTTEFSPLGLYGFYISTGEGKTWYSTCLDAGRNHFAFFQGEDRWYLGVEDASWATARPSDWDYNDMIIRGATEPVPEVGTLSMLGLGLLSLRLALRRWRN
jgi:hypothetical protein